MKKENYTLFIAGVIMLGIALRTPFTTIPTILTEIATSLQVPVSSLGLLTSLPLMMFAIFSSFAPFLARKVGLERLFGWVLLILTLASALRVLGLSTLYLGTIIIGIAIAILNVLLPSLIQANRPDKIGLMTTIYTTSMGLATAGAAAVAVPIAKVSSWQGVIWALTAICFLAWLVWLPNSRDNHFLSPTQKEQDQQHLFRNPKVWALTIFGGFQSLLFYTCMTWLPTMAVQAGISEAGSGLLASIFSLISIPFSMTIPSLVTSLSAVHRRLLLALVSGAGLVGVAMLFIQTDNFFYWLLLILLLGSCVSALFPYLLVAFSTKTSTPDQTAQLSGLAQTGGYLLAAFGPTLFGLSFEAFHSWTPAVTILLILTIIMVLALFYVDKQDKIL